MITTQKAPMAHKKTSKEQFEKKYYEIKIVFSTNLLIKNYFFNLNYDKWFIENKFFLSTNLLFTSFSILTFPYFNKHWKIALQDKKRF